jgi:SAM-dependent methyltransferase
MEQRQAADQKLFDNIAQSYAKKDLVESTAIVRQHKLITALDFLLSTGQSLGTIIDIGCGVGAPGWHLDKLYDKYIGLDHSAKLVEQANLYKKNDRSQFFTADILNLDAETIASKADLVLAVGVLHHLTDPDVLMKSLKNVAKPGAHFVAIEPHRMNPFVQLLRAIRKKVDSSYSSDQCFFKPAELMSLLQRNGLENASYKYHGFFATPFGEVILKPQWLFTNISKLTVSIDSSLDKILPRCLKRMSWCVIVRATFPKPSGDNSSNDQK